MFSGVSSIDSGRFCRSQTVPAPQIRIHQQRSYTQSRSGKQFEDLRLHTVKNRSTRSCYVQGEVPRLQYGGGQRRGWRQEARRGSSSCVVAATGGSASPSDTSAGGGDVSAREVRKLKNALLDLIEGTNCGAKADNRRAQEVDEAAEALEQATTMTSSNIMRPCTDAEEQEQQGLLSGDWKLIYTTEADVHAFLAPWLPLIGIQVGDIGQMIDVDGSRVENRIMLNTLSETGLRAGAPLKVVSETRIAYNFDYFQLFIGPFSPRLKLSKGPGGWTEVKFIDETLRVMRNSRKDLLVLERVTDRSW